MAGMFRRGKCGEFGESSAIHQTKIIQISYMDNWLNNQTN